MIHHVGNKVIIKYDLKSMYADKKQGLALYRNGLCLKAKR